MDYAIMKTGGKQYRVREGDTLDIEKITGDTGDKVIFDQILMTSIKGKIDIGKPIVNGAIVNARISNLYFGVSDKEKGFRAVVNENKLFYSKHLELVESGIMKNECKGIIKDFFIKKRKNSNNTSE